MEVELGRVQMERREARLSRRWPFDCSEMGRPQTAVRREGTGGACARGGAGGRRGAKEIGLSDRPEEAGWRPSVLTSSQKAQDGSPVVRMTGLLRVGW